MFADRYGIAKQIGMADRYMVYHQNINTRDPYRQGLIFYRMVTK